MPIAIFPAVAGDDGWIDKSQLGVYPPIENVEVHTTDVELSTKSSIVAQGLTEL